MYSAYNYIVKKNNYNRYLGTLSKNQYVLPESNTSNKLL